MMDKKAIARILLLVSLVCNTILKHVLNVPSSSYLYSLTLLMLYIASVLIRPLKLKYFILDPVYFALYIIMEITINMHRYDLTMIIFKIIVALSLIVLGVLVYKKYIRYWLR